MVQKQRSKKRVEHYTAIGPLLKQVLDEQKSKVNEVTYDSINISDYEAGEIIAKKILGLA